MENKFAIHFKNSERVSAAIREEHFLEYVKEMDAKFAVFHYKPESEKKQRMALFVASCGAPLRKWFARSAGSTEESETYESAKLKKNLCVNRQLIYLISQMQDLKQEADQALQDFDMVIKEHSQKIDWDNVKEKYNLHDFMYLVTLMRGTNNQKIREYCPDSKGVNKGRVSSLQRG